MATSALKQAQVDNLVSQLSGELYNLLHTANRLEVLVEKYTDMTTDDATVFTDNPPSEGNEGITGADVSNIIAHTNAVLGEITNRRRDLTRIVQTSPL